MLQALLGTMTRQARARGMNDRQWAAAAQVRKETLSRVKRRGSCDAATLQALARACGLELAAITPGTANAPADAVGDGRFPWRFDRDLEERLLELCASGETDPRHWRALGPGFFMGGLANLLACFDDLDPDHRYATLAAALHPGVPSPEAFDLWLLRSPVKPSRFLPMLRKLRSHRFPLKDHVHAAQ